MSEDIVQYTTETGVAITLSPVTVKQYLVSGNGVVSDQEVMMFLQLCRAQKLNPFLREAYLIKYGNSPAQIVTGKETFMKRAERHPQFDGFEAGITVVTKDGPIERREGSLLGFQTERLVGGWARIHRKDRRQPFFAEVSFEEYVGRKNDGTVNSQWTKMPGTMIRKVAIVQALREAFPEDFGGMYAPEEMRDVDESALPQQPLSQPSQEWEDPEPCVDQETLEEIRALKLELGVNDMQYRMQLVWAQEGPCEKDADLSIAGAEKLVGRYRQLRAERVPHTSPEEPGSQYEDLGDQPEIDL